MWERPYIIALGMVMLAVLVAVLADEAITQRRGGPTVDCKVTYLEVKASHGVRSDGGLPVRQVSNVEMSCADRVYAFAHYKHVSGLEWAQWELLEYGQTLKATMVGPSFAGKVLGMGPNPARLRAP